MDFDASPYGGFTTQLHGDTNELLRLYHFAEPSATICSPVLNASLFRHLYTSGRCLIFHYWKYSDTLFFLDGDDWLSSCQLESPKKKNRNPPKRYLLLRGFSRDVSIDKIIVSPNGYVGIFSTCKSDSEGNNCFAGCLNRQLKRVFHPIKVFYVPEIELQFFQCSYY